MKFFTLLVLLIFSSVVWSGSVEVVKLKGKVVYQGKAVKVGSKIDEGKEIEVVKGFAQLKFPDGSKMLIKNGKVKVQSVKNEKNLVQLLKGTLFAHKDAGSKTGLDIKTPKAVFAVRGTKFFINEDEEKSYLCVCEGVVNVKNDRGSVDVGKDQDIHVGKKLP